MPAGHRPGRGRGQLKEWPSENLPDGQTETKHKQRAPPPTPTRLKTISIFIYPLQSSFKTSNVHMLKTQLHSDVKTLESHFWLQPTQKGLWPILLLPVSQKKTIAISGLMHICHARRIGGPDGHDTVAGASTNVCRCPCCYLYRGETLTRKYLQKDSGPFLFRVKVVTNINRLD